MRIMLLAFVLIGLTTFASAQDSTSIEQYCLIRVTPVLLSYKVSIEIDHGQQQRVWADNRLRNEKGRIRKFNSIIDALNALGKDGWKLVNAFPVSIGDGQFCYQYIMKREVDQFRDDEDDEDEDR